MYLAATNVDGIHANHASPANFMHRNLMVEANIIHEVYASGVRKLLFLGPFCIYPKLMAQPVGENAFGRSMGAYQQAHTVAKVAGAKLCESYDRQYGVDFRSAMPTN